MSFVTNKRFETRLVLGELVISNIKNRPNKIFGPNGVWHHNVAMITQIMVKRTSPKTFISNAPGSTVRLSVSEFIMVMSYRSKVWTLGEQWESIDFENSNG